MKKTILLNLVVLLVTTASAPAATHLVPDEYASIQAAIDAAVDGDVVIIAPDTYTGDGNRDIDFLGKAITVRSIDPNDPNVTATTIIDCEHAGRGFYLHRCEQPSSVIAGLTIVNGRASEGGAIYCVGVSPRIANCAIIGNVAKGRLSAYGGGIFCYGGEPKIINCTIVQNAVVAQNWLQGSGIYCEFSAPLISNCIISHNSGRAAAAIEVYRSDPKIISCLINCNDGGIKGYEHSHVTVESSIISGNSGITSTCVHSFSSLNIKDSLVMGNSTLTNACPGLDFGWESSFAVTNCTIVGNVSLSGEASAGGICYNGFSSSGSVTNSIIWGNWGSEIAPGQPNPQVTIDVSHCNIEGGYLGLGNIDDDPCFVDDGNGDYHLLEDSPCIDAGNPNYIAEPNETDLDGKPRVIGGRVDMGAYEYSPPILPAEVRIVPRTINLTSKGKWITSLFWLPEDYDVADIDPNSVVLEGEIEPEWFSVYEQQQIVIVRFSRSEVRGILAPGEVELTVSGELADGTVFEGTDVIRVIDKGKKLNQPPNVTITKPQDGAVFDALETIEIEADAWDIDGSIVKVEFFADGSKIGEDNDGTDGWKSSWNNHPVGSYSFTAKATDNDGAATTSSAVGITVVETPLPGQASNPNPADGATGVIPYANLSWTAGPNAVSHDVYFGTTSPGTFRGNQTATTFYPCTMASGTTYYWRIDEVNAGGTTTGTVWSFTTAGIR